MADHVRAPDGTSLPVRTVRARGATATLVLAHGAGSSMRHPSLVRLQDGLAARGVTVVTFDFPYRARGSGAPDRMPVLVAAYEAVVAAVRSDRPARLLVGGRSLGGRAASHLAAAGTPVDGLVFVAFPLHPPGKPGTNRADHLATIRAPMLFVQGTRDTFARFDLLTNVVSTLPTATLHTIPDADHGLHVPKRTGRTDGDVLDETITTIAEWIARA
jgi:predicted alpha/beta-hydrolase family hydrolase